MNQTAESFDNEIARLYIATTVEAACFAVCMGGIIIFFLGWTSFAILQAIGMVLMAMLLGKAVLKLRLGRIKKRLEKKLEQNQIDKDKFMEFLKDQAMTFEFLNRLYASSHADAPSCQKS